VACRRLRLIGCCRGAPSALPGRAEVVPMSRDHARYGSVTSGAGQPGSLIVILAPIMMVRVGMRVPFCGRPPVTAIWAGKPWPWMSIDLRWGPHGDHTSYVRLLASRWKGLLRSRCTPLTCVNGYPHVLGVKGLQVQILSSRRHDGRFPFVGGAAHQPCGDAVLLGSSVAWG
jgi:hypothetical protein